MSLALSTLNSESKILFIPFIYFEIFIVGHISKVCYKLFYDFFSKSRLNLNHVDHQTSFRSQSDHHRDHLPLYV